MKRKVTSGEPTPETEARGPCPVRGSPRACPRSVPDRTRLCEGRRPSPTLGEDTDNPTLEPDGHGNRLQTGFEWVQLPPASLTTRLPVQTTSTLGAETCPGNQSALDPQPARLVQEVPHLSCHVPKTRGRAEDDRVVISQLRRHGWTAKSRDPRVYAPSRELTPSVFSHIPMPQRNLRRTRLPARRSRFGKPDRTPEPKPWDCRGPPKIVAETLALSVNNRPAGYQPTRELASAQK